MGPKLVCIAPINNRGSYATVAANFAEGLFVRLLSTISRKSGGAFITDIGK